MRCYLIRHAQTAWNDVNRLQGIFTSALQRSRQTAQMIAVGNGHGISPLVELELAEIHLGAWEGLTPEEVDARFDRSYQRWRERPSSVVIPEAEPLEMFRARVRRAFGKIVAGPGDGERVIVTHGGVIAAVLADVLAADYDGLVRRLRLDNAGITALECGTGLPHVLWVNSTSHLG